MIILDRLHACVNILNGSLDRPLTEPERSEIIGVLDLFGIFLSTMNKLKVQMGSLFQ